jgi:hypothetical protein
LVGSGNSPGATGISAENKGGKATSIEADGGLVMGGEGRENRKLMPLKSKFNRNNIKKYKPWENNTKIRRGNGMDRITIFLFDCHPPICSIPHPNDRSKRKYCQTKTMFVHPSIHHSIWVSNSLHF